MLWLDLDPPAAIAFMREEVARLRGLTINQVLGLGGPPANGAAQVAASEPVAVAEEAGA